ncbi:MAG TPA: hypothetical protein PJ992_09505 [Arachnia sp.]|nr:hypothetical protein [Arachnia sp.]
MESALDRVPHSRRTTTVSTDDLDAKPQSTGEELLPGGVRKSSTSLAA